MQTFKVRDVGTPTVAVTETDGRNFLKVRIIPAGGGLHYMDRHDILALYSLAMLCNGPNIEGIGVHLVEEAV